MLHTFAQKVRQIGKIECLIEQLCLQYILCLGVSAEMNQTVGPLNHMALIQQCQRFLVFTQSSEDKRLILLQALYAGVLSPVKCYGTIKVADRLHRILPIGMSLLGEGAALVQCRQVVI